MGGIKPKRCGSTHQYLITARKSGNCFVTERAEKTQWVLRLILWFVTSYTMIIIVHETAHAVVAYAFGLNPTLYQFWVVSTLTVQR